MTRVTRALLPLALLAAAASASAQGTRDPIGVRVHIGYGFSSGFDRLDGSSARVEGPEIGVAFPVGTFLGQELLLEPSYFGGGRGRKGGDDDSDIYRFTAFLHRTFARGIGGRAGVGFSSSSRARGGGFNGESGLIFDFGVEIPFTYSKLKGISPYVDLHAVIGTEDQLSGVFLGIGTKL